MRPSAKQSVKKVLEFEQALHGYAFGILKDWEEAHEVIKQAFLEIQKTHTQKTDDALFIWAKHIVHEKCTAAIKARPPDTRQDPKQIDDIFTRNLDELWTPQMVGSLVSLTDALSKCMAHFSQGSYDLLYNYFTSSPSAMGPRGVVLSRKQMGSSAQRLKQEMRACVNQKLKKPFVTDFGEIESVLDAYYSDPQNPVVPDELKNFLTSSPDAISTLTLYVVEWTCFAIVATSIVEPKKRHEVAEYLKEHAPTVKKSYTVKDKPSTKVPIAPKKVIDPKQKQKPKEQPKEGKTKPQFTKSPIQEASHTYQELPTTVPQPGVPRRAAPPPRKKSKLPLVIFISIFVLAIVGVGGYVLVKKVIIGEAKPVWVANLGGVGETVWIDRDDSLLPEPEATGPIFTSDRFETGEEGFVELQYPNKKTIVVLYENSTLYLPTQHDKDLAGKILNLDTGVIKAQIEVEAMSPPMTIVTPLVKIITSQSTLAVKTTPNLVQVENASGTVELQSVSDKSKTLTLNKQEFGEFSLEKGFVKGKLDLTSSGAITNQ